VAATAAATPAEAAIRERNALTGEETGLDDAGENGVDLIKNILRMFAESDHHLLALGASIRNLQHLLYSFHAGADLVTVPARILEQWSSEGMPLPDEEFGYDPQGAQIP